jgi:hypothetical protein
VLENFESMIGRFVKVFPHEFKRVMGVPRAAANAQWPIVGQRTEAGKGVEVGG